MVVGGVTRGSYAATSWTEVLRTRRPSPEMHVGARAHAAGVVMGTASLCIRALKLQQLYTHYQQHCTRDEVPHTHTHVSHAPRVVSFAKHASDLTFALSGGSHAPRRHTRTHTTVRQMLQLRQAPAPFSPLRRQNIHTHTHTAHTRLEGLRNSRAVVVITGRGRPCGLP